MCTGFVFGKCLLKGIYGCSRACFNGRKYAEAIWRVPILLIAGVHGLSDVKIRYNRECCIDPAIPCAFGEREAVWDFALLQNYTKKATSL